MKNQPNEQATPATTERERERESMPLAKLARAQKDNRASLSISLSLSLSVSFAAVMLRERSWPGIEFGMDRFHAVESETSARKYLLLDIC